MKIVKESQKLGLKAVKPNTDCKDVDFACRNYIEEHELWEIFYPLYRSWNWIRST